MLIYDFSIVILNIVKNLKTSTVCIQILRDAQNDTEFSNFNVSCPWSSCPYEPNNIHSTYADASKPYEYA